MSTKSGQLQFVEELDAAERDGVGPASHLLDGGEVDEIVADLLLRQPVRGLAEEAGQVDHGLGVVRLASSWEPLPSF